MVNDVDTIAQEGPFEILRRDHKILFFIRSSGAWGLVTLICGGLAFITSLNTLIQVFVANLSWLGVLVLGAMSVVFTLCACFAYRFYKKNVSAPIVPVLILDESQSVLQEGAGLLLAPVHQVFSTITIWTIGTSFGVGFLRALILKWPGGQQVVFKSHDRELLEKIQSVLAEKGLVSAR